MKAEGGTVQAGAERFCNLGPQLFLVAACRAAFGHHRPFFQGSDPARVGMNLLPAG